jgi:4-amino-4-deoxy-L-arabinose transferase-like glycosyltransferase
MRVDAPVEDARAEAPEPHDAVANEYPPRDNLRTFCYWILGAVALGFAVRLAYAYGWKWDQPLAVANSEGFGGDAGYYHFQANAIAEGLWFVDPWSWALRKTGVFPGAEHPPLYTLFLAIPSTLGFDTFREHVVAGTILGSLTCGVVGFAGRAVAGRRVGIVAAFIAAVYANLWINDALVMSETITALLAAFVIWFAYRFWQAPSVKHAVLFGFACGLASLTRAEFVFFFPIVALPLVLRARGLVTRDKLQRGGVIVVMAALPVLPWVGFNMARFDEPVTLSTGGDFTLANTYCDTTFYGERLGWWDLTCMQDRWAIEGDESTVSQEFRKDGLDYLGDHLDRFPVVVAARVGRMWEIYDPVQKLRWDSYEQGRNPNQVTWIALAQFYVLAVLAIVGLVMLRRRKTIIYPLVGLAITCTLAAMIAFGGTRYRVPAEIAIVIAAAVPLVALLDRWLPPRPGRAGPARDDGDRGAAADLPASSDDHEPVAEPTRAPEPV